MAAATLGCTRRLGLEPGLRSPHSGYIQSLCARRSLHIHFPCIIILGALSLARLPAVAPACQPIPCPTRVYNSPPPPPVPLHSTALPSPTCGLSYLTGFCNHLLGGFLPIILVHFVTSFFCYWVHHHHCPGQGHHVRQGGQVGR